MKSKIGYKVVRETYYSAIRDGIYYKINEWVCPKPGHGPLCVFEDLKSASRFISNSGLHIYRCEYIPSPCDRVWEEDRYCYKNLIALPCGTVLAKKVKLLELVKDE